MKKIIFVILVLSLSIACQNKKTNSFTDENMLFSVDFKQEPIKAVDTFETEIGEIVLHTFMVEESATVAKTVTYSDYPKEIAALKEPYQILKSAKDGALKSLGITNIILDEQVTENGVPGIEIKGSNDLGFYIHYKLLLKENSLFQIGYLKEGDAKETAEDLNFIKSFVIL